MQANIECTIVSSGAWRVSALHVEYSTQLSNVSFLWVSPGRLHCRPPSVKLQLHSFFHTLDALGSCVMPTLSLRAQTGHVPRKSQSKDPYHTYDSISCLMNRR